MKSFDQILSSVDVWVKAELILRPMKTKFYLLIMWIKIKLCMYVCMCVGTDKGQLCCIHVDHWFSAFLYRDQLQQPDIT